VSKADPKHGRWILPLVVAGLIFFTWWFVNGLDPGTVPGATTTTVAAASSSSSTSSTSSTTTTTLAPEFEALVLTIAELRSQASELLDEAQTVNAAWDDGEAGFGATRDALDALRVKAATLATATNGVELPEAFPGTWDEITASADAMATAGDDMYEGFIGPSSGPRRAALNEFVTAATGMVEALDDAEAAISG
jgi:hypothetical protein